MTHAPFRDIPYMGVIYVVVEAMKLGFSADNPEWTNLGQGQPEFGPLEGAPPRYTTLDFRPSDHAYGPVDGLPELKARVAEHYNRLYRKGMPSQYGAENVSIAAGGRTTLTRAFAALDKINLGYFIPDYTAYEDLLTAFKQVNPILIALETKNGFAIEPDELSKIISKNALDALLISNPCNPTGRVIKGAELEAWVSLSRKTNCALLMDEYYSHYIYDGSDRPVSSAEFIEDVNKDPLVIFDGLTKNFRYHGWRVGWALGPRERVQKITAAGSFIDGGAPRAMQKAAFDILEPKRADQETQAVRVNFQKKRDVMCRSLAEMGILFPRESEATFYAFGDVSKLSPQFNDGMKFFREALKHKVMTVPGEFFDVNPQKLRKGPSPLSQFVRFSFGPPMQNMLNGLQRLKKMLS